MRSKPIYIHIIFLLSAFLSACSSAAQPAAIALPTVTAQVTATAEAVLPAQAPVASPTAEATAVSQEPRPVEYVFNIFMDYDQKRMQVDESIVFYNNSGEGIGDMLLAVEPNLIAGVFSLESLQMDGVDVAEYTLEGQRLGWKLPSVLENGKFARIALKYSLALPLIEQGDPNVIRPQIFGVTARQVNLTDWYPMVVPFTPGQGWRLADPWFYGEHLVYPLASFDVTLKFNDPGNAPVVAASAPAEKLEDGSIHYAMPGGRDFVMSMGRQLQVLVMDVEGIQLLSYFYPGNEIAGQAVLDATAQAVRLYADLFGAYPHSSLSVVQGDFNDGMEFDGLYYLSNSFYNLYDNTPNNYLVMVAAHETCHQWWFGRVANDQANEPWLDESLSTYCEKLYYEKYYPDSLAWWWSYRIDFYQPGGMIDGDVPGYGGFDPYTNAVYRLGARFLEDLRNAIGDDVFFAFIKDYSNRMNGKIATSADFLQVLKEHTNSDLTAIWSSYFSNPPQ